MFAKFIISIDDVRKYISPRSQLLTERKAAQSAEIANVQQSILKLFENQNGVVSGDCLKSEFFPTDMKKKYNVFISHSHQNIDEIEEFALKLEKDFHVKCFVDSMVWKNIDDLQRDIDNGYSKDNRGGYNYEAVKNSTAHIHSLLAIALFEMIDQCECCIFVGSNQSLSFDFNSLKTTTLSPWIYEEIFYMNHTKEQELDRFERKYRKSRQLNCFSEGFSLKMSHAVDLSSFNPLRIARLEINDYQWHYGEEHLTKLYLRSGIIEAFI